MSTAEEQNSPQYFRRQLKEIEPRLSSKKLDEIMRLHNTLLSQHTQRAERELSNLRLALASIVHQEGGEYTLNKSSIVSSPRELWMDDKPDGLGIQLSTKDSTNKEEL